MNIDGSHDHIIIGCDPGPIAGIVVLRWTPEKLPAAMPIIVQVSSLGLLPVIRALAVGETPVFLSYEVYVIGQRSARTSHAAAGAITRSMCGMLDTLADDRITIRRRNMGQISDYASDERLSAVGLLQITKKMPHAYSAARHAIYSARADLGIDPLSKRYRKPPGTSASLTFSA